MKVDEAISVAGRAVPDVRFHLPAPALRNLVTTYYRVDAPAPLTDSLHPEWANIRFSLSGHWELEDLESGAMAASPAAALFGPTDRTRHFSTSGGAMLGIGFTPMGWIRLIGGKASALANRFIDLGDVLGTPGDDLARSLQACADEPGQISLLDELLAGRADPDSKRSELALRVHDALVSGSAEDVVAFAEQVGVPPAKLNRLCQRAFGFSPKRLLRRQRFLRTLGAVRDALDRPLTELIDAAYYDQAHFNRDFRAYMGTTPSAYFNSPREVLRRAAEERRRVVGAPVQGLHPSTRS